MEKIKKTSIKIAFPDYKGKIWVAVVGNILSFTGPNTYDDQVKFIEEKFEGLNANPDK
jgi:hypothetical protein